MSAKEPKSISDRVRFIIARGVLRKVLSNYLHLTPCDLRFVYNEYGKPFLSLDQNHCALDFNLSHSNSMALYAVTRGRRVGVDIEYIRQDFAMLDIAESLSQKTRSGPLKQ
jgi:4'-phosphopantetheinyl transferase